MLEEHDLTTKDVEGYRKNGSVVPDMAAPWPPPWGETITVDSCSPPSGPPGPFTLTIDGDNFDVTDTFMLVGQTKDANGRRVELPGAVTARSTTQLVGDITVNRADTYDVVVGSYAGDKPWGLLGGGFQVF